MGNVKNIPTDLLLDIITRLPIEFILNCKLVCKPWHNLVSQHQSFTQLHLSRLRQLDSASGSGKVSFLVLGENQDIYYYEYDDENPTDNCVRKIKFAPPFKTYCYVLGSFNGLVCFHGLQDSAYCVCNPMTREYVLIPKFKRDSDSEEYMCYSSGFGFLPETNEYKVVELHKFKSNCNVIEAVVYTLGSGNRWRNVGRVEFGSPVSYSEPGVFTNGAVHWRDSTETKVLVFDLTEEKFCEHLSPPPLPQQVYRLREYAVGELGGVLYYAINYYMSVGIRCDIWFLKEKKDILEHEPLRWKKEFNVLQGKPLAFAKSGGVLCSTDSSLSIYDTAASASRKLVEFPSCRQIFPHKNTLALLQDLGEEDIKIQGSAETEETETLVR